MKKSQILAALALAFALGVVAPVASASAYVMAGEGASDVISGIDVALNKANGQTNCVEGSTLTAVQYNVLIGAVNGAEKDIAAATNGGVKADGTTVAVAGSAYGKLKTYMGVGGAFVTLINNAGTQSNNAAWKAYNGTEVNAYNDYASLRTYANGLVDAFQAEFEADPTMINAKNAGEGLRNPGTGAINISDAIVTGATNSGYNAIKGQLATMGQVTSGITTYEQAVTVAKAMPKYNNFVTLLNEYGLLSKINVSTTEGYRVSTAQKALDQFNADLANFCSTDLNSGTVETPDPDTNEPAPEKPAEDDKNTPKPGNTGTIAGADATAKATVSIMAAIASVATAAFVAIRKIAAGKKA